MDSIGTLDAVDLHREGAWWNACGVAGRLTLFGT